MQVLDESWNTCLIEVHLLLSRSAVKELGALQQPFKHFCKLLLLLTPCDGTC